MSSEMEDRAAQLVERAHGGQLDKQGRDYVAHHLRPIAEMLRPYGRNAYLAGLLHDIVEDTPIRLADLSAFPTVVVAAVDSVTRRKGEPYERLIARAAAHPLGRLVKLADNWHNLCGLDELAVVDPIAAARLRNKYTTARALLIEALEARQR
jgi:(p)ppGpp synthase/HD superfamily hydrolase